MPAFLSSDAVQLAYDVHGHGSTPVLLIHGWGTSAAAWKPVLDALDLSGLRVIVPHLRGTGSSGQPPEAGGYSLERLRIDLLEVAGHAGAERFALVAHSMGAQLAQLLAVKLPDRVLGMLLFSPVPARGAHVPPEMAAALRGAGESEAAHRQILRLGTRELKAERLEQMVEDAVKIPKRVIAEGFDTWSKASFEAELSKIRAPTLVVSSDDPFIPRALLQEQVVEKIPRARLAYVPGPGHHMPNERPETVAAIVQAFLAPLST